MTRDGRPLTEAARFLRQRGEMGAGDLFLDGLTREEALRLAREARRLMAEAPADAPADALAKAPADAMAKAPAEALAARPSTPPVPAAGKGSGTGLPVLPADYEGARDAALSCTACRLHETRTQVVFSDGNPDADLMVVGEAPGANEDKTGLPFVGAAGQFLDLLLRTVDLSREDSVYICNVLKCRPPGNRNPQPDEIESCTPFLVRQIELVTPKAILAVGTFAAQFLTGQQKALGRLRGDLHAYQGVPVVVTYHPAALLRNSKWTRAFWDDLQLLRTVMDEA